MERMRTRCAARQAAVLLAAVAAVAVPRLAVAGRTAHLLTREAEIVPEGEVELEQWVWGIGRIPAEPARTSSQWVWWGPVLSVSPHLELAAPLELAGRAGQLGLASLGLQARYRLLPRTEDEGFQPLVRVGYTHAFAPFGSPELLLDFVATHGSPSGPRVTGNVGAQLRMPFLANSRRAVDVVGTGSLGFSSALPGVPGLRLAAELATELGPSHVRLYAGPSLTWSRGPFWITFGSLFGLTDTSPRLFPKVIWAVML